MPFACFMHKPHIRSRTQVRLAALCAMLAGAGAPPAEAQTLAPYDQGTISQYTLTQYLPGPVTLVEQSFTHNPADTSMLAGSYEIPGGAGTVSYRDWVSNSYVLFNVPANIGNPTAAELRFNVAGAAFGPLSEFAGFVWRAWDISSPASAFQLAYAGDITPAGTALLNDLQSGTAYGDGQTYADGAVAFSFNSAGLANLAAARGAVFGIGFSGVGTSRYGLPQVNLSALELRITAVPEPAPAALLALGIVALAALASCRRTDTPCPPRPQPCHS